MLFAYPTQQSNHLLVPLSPHVVSWSPHHILVEDLRHHQLVVERCQSDEADSTHLERQQAHTGLELLPHHLCPGSFQQPVTVCKTNIGICTTKNIRNILR
jgi:hypothetical protein